MIILGALTVQLDAHAKDTMVVNCGRTTDVERCMSCNAFREAGVVGFEGMVRVNRTVIARSRSGLFPKNICEVIYQRNQFSWTRRPRTIVTKKQWAQARLAAFTAMKRGSNGKMFYYASWAKKPRWAYHCIGANRPKGDTHIFFENCARGVQMAQYKRVTRSRIAAVEEPLISIPVESDSSR